LLSKPGREDSVKTLREAAGVLFDAIKSFWGELFFLAVMNVVTMIPVLLSLVLLYGAAGLYGGGHLGWVTVLLALQIVPAILFPPALAGLWNAANRVADEYVPYWRDYFEGFRLYFWRSLALAIMNVFVATTMIIGVPFYAPSSTPLNLSSSASTVLMMGVIVFGVMWFVYQMYPLALLIEQTDKRLHLALRNAAILFLHRPGFSALIAVALFIVIALSAVLWLPLVLITWSLIAVICNKAVKHLLVPEIERARAEEERLKREQAEGSLSTTGQ
jgi:hypothetical protein